MHEKSGFGETRNSRRMAQRHVQRESHGANADHTHRNEFVNSKEGRALYGDEE